MSATTAGPVANRCCSCTATCPRRCSGSRRCWRCRTASGRWPRPARFRRHRDVPVDASRGLRDFADDVPAIVGALGLDRVHLVGWSMGGGVAAVRHRPAGRGRRADAGRPRLAVRLRRYGAGGRPAGAPRRCRLGRRRREPRVRQADRRRRPGGDPLSPRGVMNAVYFSGATAGDHRGPLSSPRWLPPGSGEDFYPGDSAASPHWPGVAPGRRGVLNAMAPVHCDLSGIGACTPSRRCCGCAAPRTGSSPTPRCWTGGARPDGRDPRLAGCGVMPPQPMVAQTRAGCWTATRRAAEVREVVVDGCRPRPARGAAGGVPSGTVRVPARLRRVLTRSSVVAGDRAGWARWKLQRKHAVLLLAIAAWNLFSYGNFAKNLYRAHAAGEDRPTGYWVAHIGLIVVNSAIAGVLGRLGLKAWRAAR